MTTIATKLKNKQTVANGLITQAKGVVQERWGELTHDEITRLTGKKNQAAGKLQKNYGQSWAARYANPILLGTVVATALAVFNYLHARKLVHSR